MNRKNIIIILTVIISIVTGVFAYYYINKDTSKDTKTNDLKPTPTLSATTTPMKTNNIFKFEDIKIVDKIGQMTVKSIENEEGYITVKFDGAVEISGDYISNYSGMSGQYITLNLDEESRNKIPYEKGQEHFEIVLDPEYQKDKDLLKIFGKTGTKGKFKIAIDDYYVTNWIEAIPRVAKISKVIKITPEKP